MKSDKKRIVVNLSKKMADLLPKHIARLLKMIGRKANEIGSSAFVVGGLVRDLLMGFKNIDLDIVVEGDAIELGSALVGDLGAALVAHKRFGTCTILTKEKLKIDLATARKESYERPAALPTVEFSSLKNDLSRRDFTINAMAVSINRETFGQLIDFFKGVSDLRHGRIRVMHDKSFIDDPTRIFRAVRFEQRFGFAIDGHTQELIQNAVGPERMFEHVGPQRIRDEVILILKEKEPIRALKRMEELHEFRFIHPKIKFGRDTERSFRAVGEACEWYEGANFKKRAIDKWLIYMMALFKDLSYNDLSAICDEFAFRRRDVLRMLSYKVRGEKSIKALSETRKIPPSRIYSLLNPLSFEAVLLVMAMSSLLERRNGSLANSRIKDFFQKYNGVTIKLKGDDIKRLGLKPCPRYKEILRKVMVAKLDGAVRTKTDELKYAKSLIDEICG